MLWFKVLRGFIQIGSVADKMHLPVRRMALAWVKAKFEKKHYSNHVLMTAQTSIPVDI